MQKVLHYYCNLISLIVNCVELFVHLFSACVLSFCSLMTVSPESHVGTGFMLRIFAKVVSASAPLQMEASGLLVAAGVLSPPLDQLPCEGQEQGYFAGSLEGVRPRHVTILPVGS